MIKELQDSKYHDIERILNDFQNGMSYSEAIERIQGIFSETALDVCDEIYKRLIEDLGIAMLDTVNDLKQEIKDNE